MIRPLFRKWDFLLVFMALKSYPFEILISALTFYSSVKTCFLVAVGATRWVLELAALSILEPYCLFHKGKVMLGTLESLLPKVDLSFHTSQEAVLPLFCPKRQYPAHRILDFHCSPDTYLKQTESMRRLGSLFVFITWNARGSDFLNPPSLDGLDYVLWKTINRQSLLSQKGLRRIVWNPEQPLGLNKCVHFGNLQSGLLVYS